MKEMKSLSDAGKRIWIEANDVLEKRVKIRQYNQNWTTKEPMQCGREGSENANGERLE